MNAPPRRLDPSGPPSEELPADEEYARTYAAGFEEGLRSALRELLSHASRGHTNQELRALIQSRLARLSEEVDLKRRSLLSPPRPRPWDALARSTPPGSGAAPRGAEPPAVERLGPGASMLVREERPNRALELLRGNLGRYPRVVLVSLRSLELDPMSPGRVVEIPVRTPGTASADHLTPGEVGGRLKAPTEQDGGALVYVDALEFFVTEEGPDVTIRFVHFLVDQVRRTGSALLVSFDPRSLELKDQSRLERAFGQVA